MKTVLASLAALLCLLGSPALAQMAPPAPPMSAPASAGPQSIVTDSGYTLGSGDKVLVIVFGEPGLSGEFFVSSTGKVSFPLIGDVPAATLTVQAFQQELENGLRQGYLKEPRVSVEVLTYRPYYILGEVNKPGEYPYASGLTVMNAVATAGGFTYRAQTKKVFLRKNNETSERAYPLNAEVKVSPGDTIRIAERLF
jgi:protein involved in polysaccharide export with SLBB domain